MGYAPRTSFADGLKATVSWYADNRDWWNTTESLREEAR
jgi:dTDP-glucose 4,6-dehydratase